MSNDGPKTPNGRSQFQDKVAAVLTEAINLGATKFEIAVWDKMSTIRPYTDGVWIKAKEEWSAKEGREAIQSLVDLRAAHRHEVKMERDFHFFDVRAEDLGLPTSVTRLECSLAYHATDSGTENHIIVEFR
jgi:hypothetical protein